MQKDPPDYTSLSATHFWNESINADQKDPLDNKDIPPFLRYNAVESMVDAQYPKTVRVNYNFVFGIIIIFVVGFLIGRWVS